MILASSLSWLLVRPRITRDWRVWLLCLGVVALPHYAQAQPVEVATRTAARELAMQGADAFERGDYATALDHLSRANTLHPAPSIAVLQAKALIHLGRWVEALDRYEDTLRVTLSEDAPEAYRAALGEAGTESELLRQRIPHLAIQVRRGRETPKDVKVWLDGRVLPNALLDVDFPTDPGDHSIVVKGPKFDTVTRSVHLDEKERVVLEITLDAPAVQALDADVSAHAPRNFGPPLRTIGGWASLGGGAVALVVSAVTGTIALKKQSHLDSVCQPGCPASSADDIEKFRSYRTISYAAGGTALALAGLGGYLILTRPNDAPVTVGVGFVGSGATVWGAF